MGHGRPTSVLKAGNVPGLVHTADLSLFPENNRSQCTGGLGGVGTGGVGRDRVGGARRWQGLVCGE